MKLSSFSCVFNFANTSLEFISTFKSLIISDWYLFSKEVLWLLSSIGSILFWEYLLIFNLFWSNSKLLSSFNTLKLLDYILVLELSLGFVFPVDISDNWSDSVSIYFIDGNNNEFVILNFWYG